MSGQIMPIVLEEIQRQCGVRKFNFRRDNLCIMRDYLIGMQSTHSSISISKETGQS